MSETYPVPSEPTETTRVQLALEASLPAIEAVSEKELLPVNIDVPSAVMTVLGARPKLEPFRAELERIGLDSTALDRLEPFALALLSTHASYVASQRPPAPVTELVAAAVRMRDLLHATVVALQRAGVLGDSALDGYRGVVGHKTLVVDLEVLRQALRTPWSAIAGKTAITHATLDQADMIIEQLASAIGEREQAPETVAAAALRRQKAFTLLARTYDVARRGILFLRWREDDADVIAPSLYAGRNTGRRKPEPETETEADAPTAPSPPTGGDPSPRR